VSVAAPATGAALTTGGAGEADGVEEPVVEAPVPLFVGHPPSASAAVIVAAVRRITVFPTLEWDRRSAATGIGVKTVARRWAYSPLMASVRMVVLTLLALSAGCDDGAKAPDPVVPTGATSAGAAPIGSAAATPPAPAAPKDAAVDTWFRISKTGHELGVIEMLAGKPWRVVLHSANDDARALEKLVTDHGAKPLHLDMHLPSKTPGERGPYGTRTVPPEDKLYPFAVEEHLNRRGFDVSKGLPRFEDKSPPKSVSKLEFSRDGAKVGTLDLTVTPPKLELVNRDGNAIFLEAFWKELDAEDRITVSYLVPKGGRDVRETVSAQKGSPEYARMVRVAFAVRYANYSMVVVP
jgi:hypothetical protein